MRIEQASANLPELLQEFAIAADNISIALKLSSSYGGQNIYVPKNLKEDHFLVQCLGFDAANILVDLRGGEKVDIPNCKIFNALKSRIIKSVGSNRNVAKKFGVTERYVRMCRNGNGSQHDIRQQNLFD